VRHVFKYTGTPVYITWLTGENEQGKITDVYVKCDESHIAQHKSERRNSEDPRTARIARNPQNGERYVKKGGMESGARVTKNSYISER